VAPLLRFVVIVLLCRQWSGNGTSYSEETRVDTGIVLLLDLVSMLDEVTDADLASRPLSNGSCSFFGYCASV